jgi:hypothetical protein
MHKPVLDNGSISIVGSGVCIPDQNVANELGFNNTQLDAAILPPMVRRRTSQATRAAISAAVCACANLQEGQTQPAIFVSAIGEMQVTDKLCRSIAQQDYPLSPTLFHNSVHNTAAGYWSIATGSTTSMQAMGALGDSFALGMLEAWCQLQTVSDRVLLVIYDESVPEELLPDYAWTTYACALLLDRHSPNRPRISRPIQATNAAPSTTSSSFSSQNPAMATLPLFRALAQPKSGQQQILLSTGTRPWQVKLIMP